jgi:hypothetical protein
VFGIEICGVYVASPVPAQSNQEVVGGSQLSLVYTSPKPSNESDGIVSLCSNEVDHTMDVAEGLLKSNVSDHIVSIGSNEAGHIMDVLEGPSTSTGSNSVVSIGSNEADHAMDVSKGILNT